MKKMIVLHAIAALIVAFTASDAFSQGQRGGRNQKRGGAQSRQNQSGQQGIARGQGEVQRGQSGQNGSGILSAKQRQDLVLMREEEKLARDVYNAMNAKWGAPVFANIARAESRHMNAIGNLLSRYQIPDPVSNNAAGSFTTVQFQQLYKTLVASGATSLIDALKVGLKIEEMDIVDLRAAIHSTSNQDISRVYENLERASRNHLRAFALQLKKAGGTYTATSLSQAEFDQIATGQQQRGGGQASGMKNGQGNSQGQRNGRRGGRGRGR